MRKRRRLADKLTIMVCAVLVAVSAFFYAPMEVRADESLVYDVSVIDNSPELIDSSELNNFGVNVPVENKIPWYLHTGGYNLGSFDLSDYFSLDSNKFYSVNIDVGYTVSTSGSSVLFNNRYLLSNNNVFYSVLSYSGSASSNVIDSKCTTLYFYGSDTLCDLSAHIVLFSSSTSYLGCNVTASVSLSNLVEISSSDSEDYQNGYNAGFSAGEQAGYGNGYSQGFADGEASVDTNEIYNQGFNAGKESVDTQSYYDAGYQSGYQVGVQESYDIGYQDGYQSAMDRIDSWGADTSNYPLILSSESGSSYFGVTVKSFSPVQYQSFFEWTSSLQLNPNHTYRFDVRLTPTRYSYGTGDTYILNPDIYYLNIGGIKYKISDFSDSDINRFFIPGDRMSTAYSFSWEPYCSIYGSDTHSDLAYSYFDYDFSIYDMGPSGDTQNHIANQTDQLTGGYNDSQGNSVNNDFSAGLTDFETAEDSLFATATTGLKDFTFFDITSVPSMVTGMSFVGSIMSGWFTQAGGASGVGIVLSILFSIMLVAMVLGLYRWYQSKGGKD